MRWVALLICSLMATAILAADRFVSAEDLANVEAELAQLESELAGNNSSTLEELQEELVYLKVKAKKHRTAGNEGTGVTTQELEQLRYRIAQVHDELTVKAESSEYESTLPVDSQFDVRLMESLSTATALQGDRFTAVTVFPVSYLGEVLIPEGATLHGVVELVDRPESRTDRGAKLVLACDRIEFEGRSYALTATVVGASEKMETGLGDEKAKMGVGAGIGAVLGAVIGGKKGAVAGIVLGGSGAILATEGKDVELPRGTILQLQLDRDLVLPVYQTF